MLVFSCHNQFICGCIHERIWNIYIKESFFIIWWWW